MKQIKKKIKKLIYLWKQMSRKVDNKLANDSAIKDLMNHFQADEYGHEANTNKADLGYGWLHYGYIRLLKPKRVLCVGSRHGYIPAILAQGCKDNGFGHVDFVDAGYGPEDKNHWTGEGYWKTKKGKGSFLNFGLGKYITTFLMTTKLFAKKYPDTRYDYIYIDGDHSFSGVSFDHQTFFPQLNTGGIISFHDTSVKEDQSEGTYGVWRLWKKISKKDAININNPGSGVGFLQKK